MFDDLSNILDRNFLVGYTLPAATFVLFTALLFEVSGLRFSILSSLQAFIDQFDSLFGFATSLLILLGFSVFLSALNRELYRLMSGYGGWRNPIRLLKPVQIWRYNRLKAQNEALESIVMREGEASKKWGAYTRTSRKLATDFPADENLLKPTSFGNSITAFETYSYVMYGLDAIAGWPRLSLLLTKEQHRSIDKARADTTFWVNIWFLSIVFGSLSVCVSIFAAKPSILWFSLVSFALIFISEFFGKEAAIQWGEYVKGSFDVYISELAEELQLTPESVTDERRVWGAFNQAVLYQQSEYLEEVRENLENNTQLPQSTSQ